MSNKKQDYRNPFDDSRGVGVREGASRPRSLRRTATVKEKEHLINVLEFVCVDGLDCVTPSIGAEQLPLVVEPDPLVRPRMPWQSPLDQMLENRINAIFLEGGHQHPFLLIL